MENRIKKVMSAVFEIPNIEINETSTMDTIESWDSLKHMNLVIALEDEFQITIPDEEVGNLASFLLIKLIIREIIGSND
jgi:acyl carrier protein